VWLQYAFYAAAVTNALPGDSLECPAYSEATDALTTLTLVAGQPTTIKVPAGQFDVLPLRSQGLRLYVTRTAPRRVVRGETLDRRLRELRREAGRHFYWRQLRDMKGSAVVEAMVPLGLTFYARTCGWTLARAHARSGDPVAIAAYLGNSDAFDQSITDFSQRYADQNEQDYQQFVKAVHSGRLEAVEGV
jgi:hypothetical protein